MKKLLMLLSLIIVVTFSACKPKPGPEPTPGGDDTPQERAKIAKVYVDAYGSGKRLSEVWVWDKEQLKKIEYYSDNSIIYEEYYTYNEKGQIVRIDNFSDGEYVEYTYDDNKLSKARLYYDGNLEEDWRFTYKDNKISKIEFLGEDYKDTRNINVLSFVLPCESIDYVYEMVNNVSQYRSGLTLELTWDGDNISQIEGFEDGTRSILDYKYDKKLNPFNNLLGMYVEDYWEDLLGSKNNVTQIVASYYEDGENDVEITNYSYIYEGDYPTVKRENDNVTSGYVWYYEYK